MKIPQEPFIHEEIGGHTRPDPAASEEVTGMAESMIKRVKESLRPYLHDCITPSAADEAARAAIGALKRPTMAMTAAMQVEISIAPEGSPPNHVEFLSREEVANIWDTGIDAALNEG